MLEIAEAKLADAIARGDDCGAYYWRERVATYRSMRARRLRAINK